MIPKKIHYCWFGRGQMPQQAVDCIESWKKYCPDYEIVRWDEDSFDIKSNRYAYQAYKARKFAFVTDYVRLYALYHQGGIYMDTDVEVLKPLDRFLEHTAFSGYEDNKMVPTGIMASEKGGLWAKENLEAYNNRRFIRRDGSYDLTTNVKVITDYMMERGLRADDTFQDFPGLITLYPHDWFCPKSWKTGEITITDNTHTIHHFAASWHKVQYTSPILKLRRRLYAAGSKAVGALGIKPLLRRILPQ